MEKAKLLEKAIRVAVNAHFEQVDKSGMPYIFHLFRVMDRCTDIDAKIVAVLHDTIEDTDITPEKLISDGFPPHIVEAVQFLTHSENESYEGFIQRVSNNPLAVMVKIADLQDNLDLSRLAHITDRDSDRIKKYVKALAFLKSEIYGK